jgi:protein gp37
MGDVFEGRTDLNEWRVRLWQLIEDTPWLDWLLLTKRPERALDYVPWDLEWPENVWVGTTVENQRWVDHRRKRLVKAALSGDARRAG